MIINKKGRTNLKKAKLKVNETILYEYIKEKAPTAIREYMFDNRDNIKKRRQFRFDVYIPEKKIAFEYEGGGGLSRHTKIEGYKNDCDKYNLATYLGIKVYRFTCQHFSVIKRYAIEQSYIKEEVKEFINDILGGK
jgi:hypothetical protein